MLIENRCYNPEFVIKFEVYPIDDTGEGRAISQVVQANINCASNGSEVLYVSCVPEKNNGCVEIKLEDGYRLIGAYIQIDPDNIYTDNYSGSSPRKPNKSDIKIFTRTHFVFTGDNSGRLEIEATDGYLKGTINVRYIVAYRKI
jgi:hypothetical protein